MKAAAFFSQAERVATLEERADGFERDLVNERRDRGELAKEVRGLQKTVWMATGAMGVISFAAPIVLKILKVY